MKLKAIVAIDQNRGIGKDGDLLFKIKADMQHFVEQTGTDPVIMRRGTFESFGSRPLKNRMNIVISRQNDYDGNGAQVVETLQNAIDLIDEYDVAWIIGGAGLYKEALPLTDEIVLTQIFAEKEADTFFPEFKDQFELIDQKPRVEANDEHPAYQFQIWKRKNA